MAPEEGTLSSALRHRTGSGHFWTFALLSRRTFERRLQSVNGRPAKIYQSSVTDHGHRGRLRRVGLEALQAPSFKRERREQRLHVELMPLQEKQARVEHRILQNKLGGAQEIQRMDIRDWHTCLHRVMSFNERSDNEPQSYLAANPLPVKSQGVRVHVITKFSLAQRLRVVGLARVVRTWE